MSRVRFLEFGACAFLSRVTQRNGTGAGGDLAKTKIRKAHVVSPSETFATINEGSERDVAALPTSPRW